MLPSFATGCDHPLGSSLGLVGRPHALTGDGDRFESAVYAEGTKHVTDVVVDRLRAEVELVGDLFGRASVFEQTKHLDLAGGEMRVRRRGRPPFFDVASLTRTGDLLVAT